jgi:hypothetical protein
VRRPIAVVIMALALALVASACSGESYVPTAEQRQEVIDSMTFYYDRENRTIEGLNDIPLLPGQEPTLTPLYTYTSGSILASADETCDLMEEMGSGWWFTRSLAFQSDPGGWAGEDLWMGIALWESGYCPVAEESNDEWQNQGGSF